MSATAAAKKLLRAFRGGQFDVPVANTILCTATLSSLLGVHTATCVEFPLVTGVGSSAGAALNELHLNLCAAMDGNSDDVPLLITPAP